jgi:hypothetical protein
MTPEVRARIDYIRQRNLAGEATLEEVREGLAFLRQAREGASGPSPSRKLSASSKPQVTAEKLEAAAADLDDFLNS